VSVEGLTPPGPVGEANVSTRLYQCSADAAHAFEMPSELHVPPQNLRLLRVHSNLNQEGTTWSAPRLIGEFAS
jgi:hypothetical protein